MKKAFKFIAFALIAILATSETYAQNYNKSTSSKVSPADGTVNGYGYVDLGLPSGLKWATCNIGAKSPEDYGNYYAWGETKTKSSYTEENSVTHGKDISWLRSNGYIGSSGNLTPAHDAAQQNWGGSWRMPTKSEIQELIDNTTTEWYTRNGVNGRLVTSKRNGKSIFLPAASYGAINFGIGQFGRYWSATPHEPISWGADGLYFDSGNFIWDWYYRSMGRSVRPVSENTIDEEAVQKQEAACKQEEVGKQKTVPNYNGHDYVDLGLPSGLKWATCNVGATSPEGFGEYFAWGETRAKSSYTEENSATFKKDISWLRSNGYIDSSGNLTPAHDAAQQNWGGSWRMPTKAEIQELIDNTTTEWTTRNGVNGRLVTSNLNGKSIFMPAAGYRFGSLLNSTGEHGSCWSATPNESYSVSAYYLYFFSGKFDWYWSGRDHGRSVRPVSE